MDHSGACAPWVWNLGPSKTQQTSLTTRRAKSVQEAPRFLTTSTLSATSKAQAKTNTNFPPSRLSMRDKAK